MVPLPQLVKVAVFNFLMVPTGTPQMTRFLYLSLINANIRGLSEETNCRDHQDRQGDQIWESCAAFWYGHFAPLQSKKD